MTEADLEELANEARLLKKYKAGKVTFFFFWGGGGGD